LEGWTRIDGELDEKAIGAEESIAEAGTEEEEEEEDDDDTVTTGDTATCGGKVDE